MNGIMIASYSIKVKQKAKTKFSHEYLKNGLIAFSSKVRSDFKGTQKYLSFLLDSAMQPIDSNSVDYNGIWTGLLLKRSADTVQFRKTGTYILLHQINNPPINCPATYFDTIKIKTITPFLDLEPKVAQEKWVCKNSTFTLSPTIKNAKYPVKFRWSNSKIDTLPSLAVTITKDTVYTFEVSDGAGYHKKTQWTFHLLKESLVKSIKSLTVCKNDTTKLEASATNFTDTTFWKWYFEGKQISDQASIKVVTPGAYSVEASDSNFCSLKKDTVIVKNYLVKTNTGIDKEICFGNKVTLIAKDSASSNINKYAWYQISPSRTDTLLSITDSVIVSPKLDQLYYVKQINTSDSLKCIAYDSILVIVHQLQSIDLQNSKICQNNIEIALNSLILKPINPKKGIQTWALLKSLPKPSGGINTIQDLVYDKDTSSAFNYYLKADASAIKVPNKFTDTVILSLHNQDEFGCINNANNLVTITINANIEVVFGNKELSKCIGGSITYLSNDYGANYYGGKWSTENDSSSYLKWPQGDDIELNEKIYSKNLNPNGGKYLAKYTLFNHGCNSDGFAVYNLISYPKIEWSQTNTSDSVTLFDKTKNGVTRTWTLNENFYSTNSSITLSILLLTARILF